MLDRTTPPAISDFESLSIPDLCVETLPSGVELRYLDDKSLDVLNIIIVFDSGSLEAGSDVAASRLAIPLIGEGSVDHPDGQLSQLIDYLGMRVKVKAHDHHTEFAFGLLRSRLDDAIPLMREYIFEPAFSPRSVEVYKENAAQAYRLSCQKVNFHTERMASNHIFGENHPRARVLTDTDYLSLSRDDISRAYARTLSSSATVYLAGAVDDEVKSKIDSLFTGYASPTPCYNIVPHCGSGLGQRYDYLMEGKLQSSVNLLLPTIPREDPDYILLRILITALGGYFGGRLMTNIREEKGLTYGISSALLGAPEGAYISISSMTANQNVDAVISESLKEVNRLSAELFGDEEFNTVRSYMLSQLASMLDTPFNILQYHLSLKSAFIPHRDYFNRQFATIKSMNPESLREVARRQLSGRDWTVVVAGSH